eukprot:2499918-Alexandrium_andersonii.AAC.1
MESPPPGRLSDMEPSALPHASLVAHGRQRVGDTCGLPQRDGCLPLLASLLLWAPHRFDTKS